MAAPYYQDERVTLYHGDFREVLPSLADESIDFIFTDPPYGHKNNDDDDLAHRWERALGLVKRGKSAPGEPRPILNDGEEAEPLFREMVAEARRLLKPGACLATCCGGGGGPSPQFARWSLILDEIIGFKHMVVWDKGGLGMGWHYRRCYEVVLIAQKPGAACKWFGGNDVPNIIRHTEGITGIKPLAHQHPTEKPVSLPGWFIAKHTEPGDIVLDPFCGAGSTLVAAKKAGCRAIGIELDERWIEMAAKKLAQGVLL